MGQEDPAGLALVEDTKCSKSSFCTGFVLLLGGSQVFYFVPFLFLPPWGNVSNKETNKGGGASCT